MIRRYDSDYISGKEVAVMKWTTTLTNAFKGMKYSVGRFPLTVLFLVLVAMMNSFTIEEPTLDLSRFIYTSLVGSFLGTVAQMIYERFYTRSNMRYMLFGGAALLTLGYYFIAGPDLEFDTIIFIKTSVTLFALVIAFIWIPTIDNDAVSFHKSFLAAFKVFFIAALFTLVLMGGITAIYSATNYLLFEVDAEILGHLLNLVGTLFGPLYFLALTPLYSGEYEKSGLTPEEEDQKALMLSQFTVPRFLDVLISYILIPLIAIYTLILVLYVALNISGEFWTDNLLEPLLVSYAIMVILVLILSYNLENRFAVFFRRVFPKLLVPIVVFQTIASILKIREMGITHGRYYVILFGVFAVIAGFVFSFLKPKHHGLIAVALLVFAAVSIVPPIDAFTVSSRNQTRLLEETLAENNMLENGEVVQNPNASTNDRITITRTATYLYDLGYSEEVAFLPDNFNAYNDFYDTFGFNPTYEPAGGGQPTGNFAFLDTDAEFSVDINPFDYLITGSFNHNLVGETEEFNTLRFEVDGQSYAFDGERTGDYYSAILRDETGEELIRFDTQVIFDEIFGDEMAMEYVESRLTMEEATFTTENEQAELMFIVATISRDSTYTGVEFYLLIDIKE